jgi:hypothetical protein
MSLSMVIITKANFCPHPFTQLTQLLQHLVALVEDEMLQVLQVELLVADESEDAAGCADDDVRCHRLQRLLVLLNRHAAEEHSDLHARHVLAEALVLLADLEGELASVAHDEDVGLIVGGFELLESGEDEDCRLAHTALRLAENVHAQNGLWNAFVLNWREREGDCQLKKPKIDRCLLSCPHQLFHHLTKFPTATSKSPRLCLTC